MKNLSITNYYVLGSNNKLKYTNDPICKDSDYEVLATSDYRVDNLRDFICILVCAKINKKYISLFSKCNIETLDMRTL